MLTAAALWVFAVASACAAWAAYHHEPSPSMRAAETVRWRNRQWLLIAALVAAAVALASLSVVAVVQ